MRITLTNKSTSNTVVAFGLRFIAFLLAPSTSPTSSFGPVCELPLPFLWIYLDAGSGHLSGARAVLQLVTIGHGTVGLSG